METLTLTEGIIAAELSDFFGPDDRIEIARETDDFVSVNVQLNKNIGCTLIPLRWTVTSIDFFARKIRMHRRK